MRECLSLQIGQAGVQMGDCCWELYCAEHCIDRDGNRQTESDHHGLIDTFFSETGDNHYTPRSLFIDLEPSVIEQVYTGPRRRLYNQQHTVIGNEDASNNFARGYYLSKCTLLDSTLDLIRKNVEQCDSFQGFLMFASAGGGTGSGFSSLLLDEIDEWYQKKPILEFNQFISPCLSTAIVEPYNAMFRIHNSLQQSNCVFMFDNEACYGICNEKLNITDIQYSNINQLVSQAVSAITQSIRFDGTLNVDLNEYQVNLVPFPRIHYSIVSYSPFMTRTDVKERLGSVAEITDDCFHPNSHLITIHTEESKNIACCLLYRGDIVPKEINNAISNIRSKRLVNFVKWSPTGFKIGINSQPQTAVKDSDLGAAKRSLCMLSNTTAIRENWKNLCAKFDMMFAKRAFVHWYVSEGFEEGEFVEARDNLATLITEYTEMMYDDVCTIDDNSFENY